MPSSDGEFGNRKFKVFGAALDVLDMPDKIALKLAYTASIKELSLKKLPLDPYDALKDFLTLRGFASDYLEWIGKFPVESRLSPRPLAIDEKFLTQKLYTDFIDRNGCLTYSDKLISYLKSNVYPAKPVMIGVDHSLTGGVLSYLSEFNDDFNVVIFDSHTDIIDFNTKRSMLGFSNDNPNYRLLDIYECGAFLSHLLEKNIIKADRLWILGTQDTMELAERSGISPYSQAMRKWVERGVHLISKKDLIRNGIPEEIEGPTYISIDIDVGSYSCVLACRFMDRIGLGFNQFLDIINSLAKRVEKKRITLLGIDMMEIDVHFLNENVNGVQDESLEILCEIFNKLFRASENVSKK